MVLHISADSILTGWEIALIVIFSLVGAAGIGFIGYKIFMNRKNADKSH